MPFCACVRTKWTHSQIKAVAEVVSTTNKGVFVCFLLSLCWPLPSKLKEKKSWNLSFPGFTVEWNNKNSSRKLALLLSRKPHAQSPVFLLFEHKKIRSVIQIHLCIKVGNTLGFSFLWENNSLWGDGWNSVNVDLLPPLLSRQIFTVYSWTKKKPWSHRSEWALSTSLSSDSVEMYPQILWTRIWKSVYTGPGGS